LFWSSLLFLSKRSYVLLILSSYNPSNKRREKFFFKASAKILNFSTKQNKKKKKKKKRDTEFVPSQAQVYVNVGKERALYTKEAQRY